MENDILDRTDPRDDTDATQEEREMARLLARAIWLSTEKAAGRDPEPGSDAMRDGWSAAKGDMMRIANMTIRRLNGRGVSLRRD